MNNLNKFLTGLVLFLSIVFIDRVLIAQQDNAVTKLFDVEFAEISELSGIAKSRQYEDAYWVHNDSGDAPRLFALNGEGKVLIPPFLNGQYHGEETERGKESWPGLIVELAANIDWEDIAVADGNIYIADMGNNGNARRDLGIYVLTEPNPRAIFRARPLQFIPVAYPDQDSYPPEQWHFDSESLFVLDGVIYVLTKHRGEGIFQLATGTNLYRLRDWQTDRINVLEKVDSHDDVFFATAADLSPNEEWLAVTGYTELWLFPAPDEEGKWLSGEARRVGLSMLTTGVAEAITWVDDSTLLIGNERGGVFQVNVEDIPLYGGQSNWEEGMEQFRRMFPAYR
ncbi:MAG: hypothetical protein GKR91_05820 [Pseudomonadales bacterium]|nr:hypothetical protein [Pseudomonadales bacterium]